MTLSSLDRFLSGVSGCVDTPVFSLSLHEALARGEVASCADVLATEARLALRMHAEHARWRAGNELRHIRTDHAAVLRSAQALAEASAGVSTGEWASPLLGAYRRHASPCVDASALAVEGVVLALVCAVADTCAHLSREVEAGMGRAFRPSEAVVAGSKGARVAGIAARSEVRCDRDDSLLLRYLSSVASSPAPCHPQLRDVYAYASALRIGSLTPLMHGPTGFPPEADPEDRARCESDAAEEEQAALSALSVSDLARGLRQSRLAALAQSDEAMQRRFHRTLSADVLDQYLARMRALTPQVRCSYSEGADELLLALTWPAMRRRTLEERWTTLGLVRSALTLKEYVRITRRGAAPAPALCLLSLEEDGCPPPHTLLPHRSIAVQPADHAVALFSRVDGLDDASSAALIVHSEGRVLGMRMVDASTSDACACFVCHGEDGARTAIVHSLASVLLSTTYTSGFRVLASSAGFVRFAHAPEAEGMDGERARLYTGSSVTRYLHAEGGAFSREVLMADGTRLLELARGVTSKDASAFVQRLLALAPAHTRYITLTPEGAATASRSEVDDPLPHDCAPLDWSMVRRSTDAQTKALVSVFDDGRVSARYTSGAVEWYFPDGTSCATQPEGAAIAFAKTGLPTVEVNLASDAHARLHAAGGQVPMALTADRVRMRVVSCVDGSVLLVKYNTLVAAAQTASLWMVGRDRASLRATSDGGVSYRPRSAWDSACEVAFDADCADTGQPVLAPAPPTAAAASEYSFDLAACSAELRDQDLNCFRFDLLAPEPLTVNLSGEIPGALNETLCESPLAPVLLAISRAGRATEVMASNAVLDFASARCDVSSDRVSVDRANSSDLSPSHLLTVTRRRRDAERPGYSFPSVVSSPRPWHTGGASYDCAALQFALLAVRHVWSASPEGAAVRIFECVSAREHAPLAEAGLLLLRKTVQDWSQFCVQRDHSRSSFGVTDSRTAADHEEELRVKNRLKAILKQLRLEKKEARLAAVAEAGRAPETKSAAKLAGIQEAYEDSEEDFPEGSLSDEESEDSDVEAVEVEDAFSAFCSSKEDRLITSVRDLRSALVQLLSRSVSEPVLLDALALEIIDFRVVEKLEDKGVNERRRSLHANEVNVTEEEFTRLFYRLRWTLLGEDDPLTLVETDQLSRHADEPAPARGIKSEKSFPALSLASMDSSARLLRSPAGSGVNAARR